MQSVLVVHTDMYMQLHLILKMFLFEQMLNRLSFMGSCNLLVCDGTTRDEGTMLGQLVKFFVNNSIKRTRLLPLDASCLGSSPMIVQNEPAHLRIGNANTKQPVNLYYY